MNNKLKLLLILTLSTFSLSAQAAPTDFDGDGRSDPAVVKRTSPLNWKAYVSGELTSLQSSFGQLGDHLATGDYDADGRTDLAFVNSQGNWSAMIAGQEVTTNLSKKRGTYIAGLDYDGDGISDIAVHGQTCQKRKVVLSTRSNPFGSTPSSLEFTTRAIAKYYTTYGDINGDGKDDFCWLRPRKRNRKLTDKFLFECVDVATNERVGRFNAGRVYERPLPVRSRAGAPDNFVFYRRKGGETLFVIRNASGRRVHKFTFPTTDEVLVGNYLGLNDGSEQVAIADSATVNTYNPSTKQFEIIRNLNGISFDEININHFDKKLDDCICTSLHIGTSSICRKKVSDEEQLNNAGCEVLREITDGAGDWLHKPVSENTGSVVNLLDPSDDPTSCRYEDSSGDVFQDARFSGNTNPNRPTYRPVRGGSCSSFPSPLVFSCIINSAKNCWVIPDPCNRYD